MKSWWIQSLALTGALALNAHAVAGFGVHWTPAPGVKIGSSSGNINPSTSGSPPHTIVLNTQGSKGLEGLGFKVWVDALPLVDLEMTGNMQFGYYDAAFVYDGVSHPMNFDLGVPGLKNKPVYARTYGDAAVLYPFLKLPPGLSILKVYAGGGLTYGVGTQTMSAKFAKKALTKAKTAGTYNPDTDNSAKVASVLISAIEDEGLTTGMGGFLQVGAHAKVPIIPIAVYTDFKYRFLGFNPDLISGADWNLEIGGALAF